MELHFALIGCGHIGPRHGTQMANFGKIVAVCDIIPEKADFLADLYHCQAFYSLEDLLAAGLLIDVVAICTPNFLHAPQTIRCLQHGFHVICEKPMAIHASDAVEMMNTARQHNRKLFVVKQNRYNAPVASVRALIDEGKLGHIHAFQVNCFWNRTAAYYDSDWKGIKKLDGGILYTQFSHFIDLLIWYLGEADSIRSLRQNFLLREVMELEDTGFSLMTMKQGAIGTFNYTITSFDQNMEGSITLFGSKGTVKIGGQYLNTLDYFSVQETAKPVLGPQNTANQYGFYQGSMSNHDKVYRNIVMALDNRANDVVEGTEAIKTIEMIEKMYGEPTMPAGSVSL